MARLIAGDFSPAGRLPITFYKSTDQLPAFGDYAMSGRTYRYFAGQPLYPFGYGLSFTRFTYDNARVSQGHVKTGDAIMISVDVANTGRMDGDEVVQLCIKRPDVPGAPAVALAGFQRIHLTRGESRTVEFTLRDHDLSTVDPNGVRRIAPGRVEAWIGAGQPESPTTGRPASGSRARFQIASGSVIEK